MQRRPNQPRRRSSLATPLLLGLLIIGVLAGSFYVVSTYLGRSDQAHLRPIDLSVSLRGDTVWIARLGDGWGTTDSEGTFIAAPEAELLIPITKGREVDLLIRVTADNRKSKSRTLKIRTADSQLGSWDITDRDTRVFYLPAASIDGTGRLTLRFATDEQQGTFRIHAIDVMEVAAVSKFNGFVDHCDSNGIRGWAAFDGSPSPILLYRNGKLTNAEPRRVNRPDLRKAGYPVDAGFIFKVPAGTSPDESLTVRFPNAASLPGSPCKISK